MACAAVPGVFFLSVRVPDCMDKERRKAGGDRLTYPTPAGGGRRSSPRLIGAAAVVVLVLVATGEAVALGVG